MRIGYKMKHAVSVVSRYGGENVPNHLVCNAVNPCPRPSKAEGLGYDIVNRAVRAGILVRSWPAGVRGSVLSIPDHRPPHVEVAP